MSEQNLEKDESMGTQSEAEQEALLTAEAIETSDEGGAGKKTLGVERWVQLGFMVFALMLVWLYSNLINTIWYSFADPDDSIVTFASVLGGIVTALVLYRHRGTHQLSHEVAEELSKVTWPTRKETSNSTLVVVITSIVAACMLFLFDTVWSAVTDLVYKV